MRYNFFYFSINFLVKSTRNITKYVNRWYFVTTLGRANAHCHFALFAHKQNYCQRDGAFMWRDTAHEYPSTVFPWKSGAVRLRRKSGISLVVDIRRRKTQHYCTYWYKPCELTKFENKSINIIHSARLSCETMFRFTRKRQKLLFYQKQCQAFNYRAITGTWILD